MPVLATAKQGVGIQLNDNLMLSTPQKRKSVCYLEFQLCLALGSLH
jgi:hypothetical protein